MIGVNPTSVILLKKIPLAISEEEIRNALRSFGQINTVKLLLQKLYAYIEFENPYQA